MDSPRSEPPETAMPLKLTGRGAVADVVAASQTERGFGEGPLTPEDQPVCWICLDHGTPTSPLICPCKCPRHAHSTCVARWQLQSAGTRKETHCEFCDSELKDWKTTLTPQSGANAPAVMNVNFNDRTFSFEVKPGIDGYRNFTEAIRRAFGLPEDSELNITFTCDEPISSQTEPGSPLSRYDEPMPPPTPVGTPRTQIQNPATPQTSPASASLLTLQGAGAYDAAVHCASVSAAKRRTSPSSPNSGNLMQFPMQSTPVLPPYTPERTRPAPSPSAVPRTLPFSNIPGFSQPQFAPPPVQGPPSHRERGLTLPGPSFPRTFGGRQLQGFSSLPPATLPQIEEPSTLSRGASAPSRRTQSQSPRENGNFFSRAGRAVKNGLKGGRNRDSS